MASAPQERSLRDRPQRLAEKLYQIRAKLNLSQREMLNHLGFSTYHHAFVSMWERGYREPPLIALLRYAQSFGISTDVLINDELDLPSNNKPAVKLPVKRKKRGTRSVK
ncbi:MAG: helix-turn-helix domain-containing protein [Acidobacteria bacterium]|nr:helix-turn-helix domain-containing protein [Acidobacteriota bacterium]